MNIEKIVELIGGYDYVEFNKQEDEIKEDIKLEISKFILTQEFKDFYNDPKNDKYGLNITMYIIDNSDIGGTGDESEGFNKFLTLPEVRANYRKYTGIFYNNQMDEEEKYNNLKSKLEEKIDRAKKLVQINLGHSVNELFAIKVTKIHIGSEHYYQVLNDKDNKDINEFAFNTILNLSKTKEDPINGTESVVDKFTFSLYCEELSVGDKVYTDINMSKLVSDGEYELMGEKEKEFEGVNITLDSVYGDKTIRVVEGKIIDIVGTPNIHFYPKGVDIFPQEFIKN